MTVSASTAHGGEHRLSGRELVWAATVGLVLADSSVVTLALPDILRRFESTVLEVSWVLTSFNLALAFAVLAATRLAAGQGASRAAAVWGGGVLAFAAASLLCALAPTITVLIIGRSAQGVAGACVIAGAIELLARSRGTHQKAATVWGTAGLIGVAVGPAVGGLLTELISWESIFIVQVPVIAAVAAAIRPPRATSEQEGGPRLRLAPEVALALLSAGLTGALFLLVIMLTEGWGRSPLEAALIVSAIPVATVLARLLTRGVEHTTAGMAAGAVTLAGGLAGLGLLPGAEPYWTLAPQALIGIGIALTLPGLTGRALAGRDPAGYRAAGTISARHVGIVLGLVVLTPVFSAELPDQQVAAVRSGTALILDADLSPTTKIALGEAIADQVESAGGRIPDLTPAFEAVNPAPEARPAYLELQDQLTGELDKAATNAFSGVFLIAAGLALLALLPIAVSGAAGTGSRRRAGAVAAGLSVVASAGLVSAYLALGGADYQPLEVADPCKPRSIEELRSRDVGLLERIGLSALDGAACRLRVTREELALAVASDDARKAFMARYRVSDAGLEDAVRDGARRAIADERRLGSLSSFQASLLERAVNVVPVGTLLNALQSSRGRSIIPFLMDLAGVGR
jgi:MFS family permease